MGEEMTCDHDWVHRRSMGGYTCDKCGVDEIVDLRAALAAATRRADQLQIALDEALSRGALWANDVGRQHARADALAEALREMQRIALADHPKGVRGKFFAMYDVLRAALATVPAAADRAKDEEREAWRAHVPATNEQHDPAGGLIAGFCVRCRTPWPCEYSPESDRARLTREVVEAARAYVKVEMYSLANDAVQDALQDLQDSIAALDCAQEEPR